MYAVVGCSRCDARWLLEDPAEAETARCPRCGTRHRTRKLRRLYESENREAARQARAAMLAERSGAGEAFADLDSVAEMEGAIDAVGPSDDEFLAASGLDPEEVAAAGERAGAGPGSSPSREEVVRQAIRDADDPTEETIVASAAECGVPAEAARRLLAGLQRAGEVSENRGVYRLV